jgi:CheY-like chemotaxis protein
VQSQPILIAENNEDDIILIQALLQKANLSVPVHVVTNGEQAISYLSATGEYADRDKYPLPQLVLLDIKMPRTDGFEVLEWIRRQRGFDDLRVVMLTGIEDVRYVNRAYRLGAISFLLKPIELTELLYLTSVLKR